MKTSTLAFFFFSIAFCFSVRSFSQVLSPGQAARFGIDGDLRSDVASQGDFTAEGSHDWFRTDGGTGLGIFTATGTESHSQRISNGENFTFSKKMQFPRYSTQNGFLLLEGSYSRDFFGLGSTTANSDKTVFVSTVRESNKNWQNPTTWTTVPSGDVLPNKSDIIDTYVHMRRNGTKISGTNFSDLILVVGGTTLSTDGDHFIDFEFYKERIQYNASTGKFETPASASTGGRSPWTFNTDGTIKLFGDISLSFSFNSTQVKDIMLFIWTDYNTFTKGKLDRFSFVANSWNGENPKGGYGYAQIVPNKVNPNIMWGTVNLLQAEAPAWGTNSKEIGQVNANYVAHNYAPGQFAEAAINLTAFGIDPLYSAEKDPCQPPLTRFIAKTRSSSAFNSTLQDFTGPYEFLDAPVPSAKVPMPATLTCTQPSTSLSPEVIHEGAYYLWTTPNGSITGDPSAATITTDKAGDYTLTAAPYQGCATTSYTVKVKEDKYKPKAVVSTSGLLSADPLSFVTLKGDTTASGSTGTSKGITWQWSGPGDFSATSQNTTTQLSGDYTLTVTETASGCFTTATASVVAMMTLEVKFTAFDVYADKQKKENHLSWKMADASEVERFVAEKSINGTHFTPVGYAFADNSITDYVIRDRASDKASYYRIKAVSKTGAISYSSIIKMEGSNQDHAFKAFADGAGVITIVYTTTANETLDLRVVNMNGQVVKAVTRRVSAGTNTFKLNEITKPADGVYVVLVQGQNTMSSAKIKW